MSGIGKAIGKVFKGIGKAIKGVVKGVVKLAKGIVKGIGKVMGKLGPIGSIALAFIAPMAIGAMASSSTGWISTLGKGLQTVGKVISAPFQAIKSVGGTLLGNVAKGAGELFTNIGLEGIGEATTSLSEKLFTAIGNESGTISEAFKDVWTPVSESFTAAKDAFVDVFNPAPTTTPTISGMQIGQDVTVDGNYFVDNTTGEYINITQDIAQQNKSLIFGKLGEQGPEAFDLFNKEMLQDQTYSFLNAEGNVVEVPMQYAEEWGITDPLKPMDTSAYNVYQEAGMDMGMLGKQGVMPGSAQHQALLQEDQAFMTEEQFNQGLLTKPTVESLDGVGGVDPTGDGLDWKESTRKALSSLGDTTGVRSSMEGLGIIDPPGGSEAQALQAAKQSDNPYGIGNSFYVLNDDGKGIVESSTFTGLLTPQQFAQRSASAYNQYGNLSWA